LKISLQRKQLSIVPEIFMSARRPLKGEISAISAASSRQLLFQVDYTKIRILRENDIN